MEDDLVYAALSDYVKQASEEVRAEYYDSIESGGITILQDTAMTGLQVDVIPVSRLDLDDIDAVVRRSLRQTVVTAERESGATKEEETSGGRRAQKAADPLTHRQDGTRANYNHNHTSNHAHKHKHHSHRHNDANAVSWSNHAEDELREESYSAWWDELHKPLTPAATASPLTAASSPTQSSTSNDNHHTMDTKRHDKDAHVDARNKPRRLARHFIINMDFAFGAQAAGICRAVFSVFGRSIRSVSVMGKAGGLKGKRGDIQLASYVLLSKSSLIVEDNQDEMRPCRNQDLTVARLCELGGPQIEVHHGNVLTVTGTMLQNAPLLRYYRSIWHCVGAEMEGSYFARVIEDFYRQGIAHPDLKTRFAYYTSDLPLAKDDAIMAARQGRRDQGCTKTLSASLTPMEGVPPLYAIARSIIEKVLLG